MGAADKAANQARADTTSIEIVEESLQGDLPAKNDTDNK